MSHGWLRQFCSHWVLWVALPRVPNCSWELPGTWLPADHWLSRLSFTSPLSAAAPEPYEGLCPQGSPLWRWDPHSFRHC